MDYRFAAGDIGDFSAVCGVPFQTITDLPACPRCLAGQIIGQKNRLIAQRPGSFHGRTAQLTHTSDDAAMPVYIRTNKGVYQMLPTGEVEPTQFTVE